MKLSIKTTLLFSLCFGLIVLSACGPKAKDKPEEKPVPNQQPIAAPAPNAPTVP